MQGTFDTTVELDTMVTFAKDGDTFSISKVMVGHTPAMSILTELDAAQLDQIRQDIKDAWQVGDKVSDTIEYSLEADVEAEYSYTAGSDAYFDKNFGNWLPGDDASFELLSVMLGKVDIMDALTPKVREGIEDAALDDVATNKHESRYDSRY